MDGLTHTLELMTKAIEMSQSQAKEQFELTKLLTQRVVGLEREIESLGRWIASQELRKAEVNSHYQMEGNHEREFENRQ